jgi:aldose 1-epimerase
MLSGHHYWNLEAYKETKDLVGHHAQIASSRFVATDGALIPTGKLTKVEGTPLDFRKAKSIGGSINATAEGEYCGTGQRRDRIVRSKFVLIYILGCVGFDNAWVYDRGAKSVFSTWSVNSGIK